MMRLNIVFTIPNRGGRRNPVPGAPLFTFQMPVSAEGLAASGSDIVVCQLSTDSVNGSGLISRRYFSDTSASSDGGYFCLSA